jgi:hypothetical protein
MRIWPTYKQILHATRRIGNNLKLIPTVQRLLADVSVTLVWAMGYKTSLPIPTLEDFYPKIHPVLNTCS